MNHISKAAIALGILTLTSCTMNENNVISSEGYIAKSGITIKEGHMTPEALLAFGRLSDPQV